MKKIVIGLLMVLLMVVSVKATGLVQKEGKVGIGVDDPGAKLDIFRQATAGGTPLGEDVSFRVMGAADGHPDSGKVWIQYGEQSAPLLVLEDHDDPPRIQFQQVLSAYFWALPSTRL